MDNREKREQKIRFTTNVIREALRVIDRLTWSSAHNTTKISLYDLKVTIEELEKVHDE